MGLWGDEKVSSRVSRPHEAVECGCGGHLSLDVRVRVRVTGPPAGRDRLDGPVSAIRTRARRRGHER